jgi:hypothetical protein
LAPYVGWSLHNTKRQVLINGTIGVWETARMPHSEKASSQDLARVMVTDISILFGPSALLLAINNG